MNDKCCFFTVVKNIISLRLWQSATKRETVKRGHAVFQLHLRLNVSPIPVQIVESRGAPSSYAVLKNFMGSHGENFSALLA